ncbi:MAG: hypothetical protein R3C10_26510 [Pirellulales bacterium]
MSDDDPFAPPQVRHRNTACSWWIGRDDDATVHFLIGHRDPLTGDADLGTLVRCAVKTLGERTVHIRRRATTVLLRDRDGTMVGNVGKDLSSSARPGAVTSIRA